MDRKITFIKKVITSNAYNEDKVVSWQAVDQNPVVWARMMQRQGREVVIADRLTYMQETVFVIDNRTDLSEHENRIVFNGRPYDIIAIISHDESRDMYLQVVCTIVDNEVWT